MGVTALELPEVPELLHPTNTTIEVHDSKIGWATAFKELLSLLYSGIVPRWDLSKLRPKGAILKIFGGRSSGPVPLDELFKATISIFQRAASDGGRKLTSIECHDIMCKIGDIVVVGGVRRSALISLSNLSDDRMRQAKSGQWWTLDPQRALANNSAVYTEKPSAEIFLKEMTALVESKSGERGIFNRYATRKFVELLGRREDHKDFGTNPCGEIILRPEQCCNLTEVVVRQDDTLQNLKRKVVLATILGTFQATLTNFRYIRKKWKHNAEEETLLGVSLTGVCDHPVLSGNVCDPVNPLSEILKNLRDTAINTNMDWSEKLGINTSAAVTCVKPSGTVSQLVDSASGLHPRYSPYYIRTVRANNADPLAKFMVDTGFPVENDVTKPETTYVFSFPTKAPEHSVFRKERTAIQQLEHWLIYKQNWCEHNPSVTIYVKDHEWPTVIGWVYDHFDYVGGLSFLPYSDHSYQQAPYQEITKEEYEDWCARMPKNVDWSKLAEFEQEDQTTASQELACISGACDLL